MTRTSHSHARYVALAASLAALAMACGPSVHDEDVGSSRAALTDDHGQGGTTSPPPGGTDTPGTPPAPAPVVAQQPTVEPDEGSAPPCTANGVESDSADYTCCSFSSDGGSPYWAACTVSGVDPNGIPFSIQFACVDPPADPPPAVGLIEDTSVDSGDGGGNVCAAGPEFMITSCMGCNTHY